MATNSKETSFFIHAPPFAVFFCHISDPLSAGRRKKQNFVLLLFTIMVPIVGQSAEPFETPWKTALFCVCAGRPVASYHHQFSNECCRCTTRVWQTINTKPSKPAIDYCATPQCSMNLPPRHQGTKKICSGLNPKAFSVGF